jgi:pimeloyl-ACP methyl ester carboxylesterase
MKRLVVALPIIAACACASAPSSRGVSEGVTPNGIAYDVRGSGPTVVLLHGGILDRRMWEYEAGALSSQFRVVRYDLRGHGRSADVSAPFSASDDLVAVLDAVAAPRAHLVGLSKGGSVALDFAIAHPARVDRLVLAGAFPSGAQVTERLPGIDSLIAATRRGDVDRAASLVADMPAFVAPPERARWVRSLVMSNARIFRQSPTAEQQLSPPAMARLGEVRAPTLVIVGDRDARDILVAADSLVAGIRGAQRATVPGAGHLVNVWADREFSRLVTGFLRGARGQGSGDSERSEGTASALGFPPNPDPWPLAPPHQ